MANNKLKVNFTEGMIAQLLAKKHESDLFVAGCKNGPTHSTRKLLILDAWAFRKTWSPPTTIGYEIKVDRNDFIRDEKWMGYLPYVHEFYFVCPPGLIRPVDLPKGVGLIWTTMNGQRLITKLRPQREQPDLEKMLQLISYVLMARTVIAPDMYAAGAGVLDPEKERLDRIKRDIELADTRKNLASIVSRHMHERFEDMARRCREAESQGSWATEFSERLSRLGIEWDPSANDWMDRNRVQEEISALRKHMSDSTLKKMEASAAALSTLVKELRDLKSKNIS